MSMNTPHELLQIIDIEGEGLTQWEINFVAGLIDKEIFGYSEKQIKIIERIYDEKC